MLEIELTYTLICDVCGNDSETKSIDDLIPLGWKIQGIAREAEEETDTLCVDDILGFYGATISDSEDFTVMVICPHCNPVNLDPGDYDPKEWEMYTSEA